MAASVKGAIADAGIHPSDVLAMAVDTTCCSVVALDQQGEALRPALIWMDVRAAEEAAMVGATGDPALRVNAAGSGQVSAEWMIPKALWIKRHEPEIFARAARICEYQDYINLRLTGRYVGSLNNMSVRWHYHSSMAANPTTCLRASGWPSFRHAGHNKSRHRAMLSTA